MPEFKGDLANRIALFIVINSQLGKSGSMNIQ
jgi:hypothetical protein